MKFETIEFMICRKLLLAKKLIRPTASDMSHSQDGIFYNFTMVVSFLCE